MYTPTSLFYTPHKILTKAESTFNVDVVKYGSVLPRNVGLSNLKNLVLVEN